MVPGAETPAILDYPFGIPENDKGYYQFGASGVRRVKLWVVRATLVRGGP
jgi:hypothetical protein